jgi:hypothetical protein
MSAGLENVFSIAPANFHDFLQDDQKNGFAGEQAASLPSPNLSP